MKAKRCDRCKKFYFPSDETVKYNGTIHDIGKNVTDGYEGITIRDLVIKMSYEITSYSGKSCITNLGKTDDNFDFCPKRAQSLLSWLNSTD